MPSARHPAAALADRAERHVFGLLADLDAIDRRALALIELAGADRAAAAAELGVTDLDQRLARARKALRRTKGPLSSGARCERAERLASDRLDGALPREPRKWLEIHLARCPRCTEHLDLLEQARTELRVTFLAEPPQLPPAPEPPKLETTEPKGHLRVVPEPDPEPVGGQTHLTGGSDGPAVAAQAPQPTAAPEPTAPPAPSPRSATPTRARQPSAALRRTAAIVALLLALAAIAAAIAALGDDAPQRAPWDAPDAPDVRPAPLRDQ